MKNHTELGARLPLKELRDLIRVFMRDWEDLDELPSEAAARLTSVVLGFDRIEEAHADFLREGSHV